MPPYIINTLIIVAFIAAWLAYAVTRPVEKTFDESFNDYAEKCGFSKHDLSRTIGGFYCNPQIEASYRSFLAGFRFAESKQRYELHDWITNLCIFVTFCIIVFAMSKAL
jgi:hypothetical protein